MQRREWPRCRSWWDECTKRKTRCEEPTLGQFGLTWNGIEFGLHFLVNFIGDLVAWLRYVPITQKTRIWIVIPKKLYPTDQRIELIALKCSINVYQSYLICQCLFYSLDEDSQLGLTLILINLSLIFWSNARQKISFYLICKSFNVCYLRMHSSSSSASNVGKQALFAELIIRVMLCIGRNSRMSSSTPR